MRVTYNTSVLVIACNHILYLRYICVPWCKVCKHTYLVERPRGDLKIKKNSVETPRNLNVLTR